MSLEAIRYREGKLEVLDQLLLPFSSSYVKIKNVQDGWNAINLMQVRGAPGIAIVGCLSFVVDIYNKSFDSKDSLLVEVKDKLNYLTTSRPTAVNLFKETNKLIEFAVSLNFESGVSVEEMKNRLVQAIEDLLNEDILCNKSIGVHGANKLKNISTEKIRVLTHCNTGSLATAGYGTALGVIRSLHEQQKLEHVYFTETRPFMQGARLTAFELLHEGIPSTMICDSAVAALFQRNRINAVLVGADRVTANGDTANKIGTYQIAVLAKYHNIPFYVCAPRSSIDFNTKSGDDITIEERSSAEITHLKNNRIAAPGIHCWNPAFDVTKVELIKEIITEVGCFNPSQIHELISKS